MQSKLQRWAIHVAPELRTEKAPRRRNEPLRILIAENNPILAMDLSAMIQELGGQVVGLAETAEKAIALAVRLRPDIAIIDVLLDGYIDGIAAALDIQAECDVPIVLTTERADAPATQRMLVVSDQPALVKPISRPRLREAIASACPLWREG